MPINIANFTRVCAVAIATQLLMIPLAAQSVKPLVHEVDPKLQRQKQELKAALPSLRAVLAPPMEYRLEPLSAEELQPKIRKLAGRAGVHRPVKQEASTLGRWNTLDDGRKVWRIALQSPDAAGIRVHFRSFDVGDGRVWLHDSSGREAEIMGPYTRKGPGESGEFWSDVVLSDKAVIEFEPGSEIPLAGALPFEIAEISHLFPRALPGGSVELTPEAQLGAFSQPQRAAVSTLNTDFQPYAAASCNLDVSCHPDWAETARAVGHIVYEEEGHTYVCSGTLVNTRGSSRIPYFLTADHCISSEASARTVQAFWGYQTSQCDGPPVTRREATRTLGARYLVSAGLDKGDFSLIRLNEVPSGVVFAGWTAEEVPEGTNLVGIHHPSGDYKRISFSTRVQTGRQLPGANPDYYYTVRQSRGVTEGGSSGSGIFAAPGVLVGMLSSGPKVDTPEQICQIAQPPANYGRFATAYPALRDFLEDRTTGTPTPPDGGSNPGGNNPGGNDRRLVSGQPRNFTLNAVNAATLFGGSNAFEINVPQGATRLEIRLSTTPSDVDIDLFVRQGSAPAVVNGSVVSDVHTGGPAGNETIVITPSSAPSLRAGTYYIALGIFTRGRDAQCSLTATVSGGGSSDGSAGAGARLQPGAPQRVQIPAVSSPMLFSGAKGFTVVVPQGASRLQVRLTTATPNADLDLFIRSGSEPAIVAGKIEADYRATGDTGNETITITAASGPPLRAGTYYIAIAVFTPNVAIDTTIAAELDGGGSPNPGGTGGPVVLTSGSPKTFNIPAMNSAALLNGERSFVIDVPQSAQRLEIRLSTATAGVDLDLFARFGSDPAVTNGKVQADFDSDGPTGNEIITVTPTSSPALKAGRYFISLGVFSTGAAAAGTVTATVVGADSRQPSPPGRSDITPDSPAKFQLPAVTEPTLFTGQYAYRVNVPEGATKLQINVQSDASSVDVDLYVRHGSEVEVINGEVQADHASEGETGNERIIITPTSSPALRPGTYYIALALYSTGLNASGSISVSIERAQNPGGGGSVSGARPLTMGEPVTFSLPTVTQPVLYSGESGFRVTVPDGGGRLEISLKAENLAHDLDLYVRYGAEVILEEGRPVADYRSTGDTGEEQIVIDGRSSPPLSPGVYFIGIGQFTPGVNTRGTIVARLTRTSPFSDVLQKTRVDEEGNVLNPKPGRAVALAMSAEAKSLSVQRGEIVPDTAPIMKKRASGTMRLKVD